MQRSVLLRSTILFLLLSLSGCVKERVDGSTYTYTFELWMVGSVFLVGIAAAVGGWFLKKSYSNYGWGIMFFGAVALIVGVPTAFLEKTVVTDTYYKSNSGIYGMTATSYVEYKDIRSVRIVMEIERGRRGRKDEKFYLICATSDGSSTKLSLNNDVREAAGIRLLQILNELEIPITNET